MGFRRVFIVMLTALSCSLTAFAQAGNSQALVLGGSLDMQMPANCGIIESPQPPFYVSKNDTPTLAPGGNLPKNTLVQLDTNNPDAQNLQNQGLMSVQVLSVPGAPSAVVGTHVHISNHSLLPATTTVLGTLDAPGSIANLDGNKYVFVIRRESPYFNIPELRGKAVRLAQDAPHLYPPMTANYFLKRCCPTPQPQSESDRYYSGYTPKPYEEKRNPNCTYQPVFEIMKPSGEGANLRYTPDGSFMTGASDRACRDLLSGLTPAGAESYNWMKTTLDQGVRFSEAWLNRLRSISSDEVGKTRNGISGRGSKGACRAAWRAACVRMGLLKQGDHPPTDRSDWHPASGLAPWLGQQPGWKDVTKQYNSQNVPVGCTLVYGGSGAGHVEFRTQANEYCSDYCSSRPRDASGGRPLTGVFCPTGAR